MSVSFYDFYACIVCNLHRIALMNDKIDNKFHIRQKFLQPYVGTKDGRGAHSVTSMVAFCRKGQKAKKLTLRPNKSLQCQTRPKRPKSQTTNFNFQGQQESKRPNLTYLALRKAKWQPILYYI